MTTCTMCKRREPFFLRAYSGERLCRRCFCLSIEKKVRTTISKYEMFEPDDEIAVAVSGGKDSVSLLHIMVKIEEDFPKATLSAVIVDEGIRGYRDEAMKIAIKNCEKLGVEYLVVSFKELYGYTLDEIVNMTKDAELTPCSYCGVLRRRAINAGARLAGVDKVATAHNLDDETQTSLLNIIHGDPLRILRVKPVLTPIQPGLIQRVKPLCEVPEREIALYAYVKRIEFQSVPCPYAGSALRNDVRNILNRLEEKRPGTKYKIYRSMEKIRTLLEKTTVKAELRICAICGEPTVGEICQTCRILQELKLT
ncbi:MAG: TIGR00269 family protein [Candidatus Bathyarchaeia archaeon]